MSTQEKKKKSVRLSTEEKKELKKSLTQFDTKEEAAKAIKISRGTLHDLESRGSCSGSTYQKITAWISQQ